MVGKNTVYIKPETFQREHINYEKHFFYHFKREGVFSPSIWFALAVKYIPVGCLILFWITFTMLLLFLYIL